MGAARHPHPPSAGGSLPGTPELGPAQTLAPGASFATFRSFVLAPDRDERERTDLLMRRMYRTTIEIVESGIYTREGVPHEGALLELYDANTEGEAHDR